MRSHLARVPHCLGNMWCTLNYMIFSRTLEPRRVSRCLEGPDITPRLGVSNSACARTIAAAENVVDTSNSRTREELKSTSTVHWLVVMGALSRNAETRWDI